MKFKLAYLLVLIGLVGKTQTEIKFSNQYLVNNNTGLSTNLIKYQNKYCLMGIGGNTLTNQYQGLCFLKTDSLGNQLSSNQIFHPLNYAYYANSSSNAFIKIDSTKALFTGEVELGVDYNKATLVKINLKTLDTLWTRVYSQPGDSSWLLCSNILSDSSIISLGFKYYNTTTFKPFMMKVDKNGTYKWHKYINATWSNSLYLYQKIIKINDNDFVVVGYKYNNICQPQAFCMRIDTNAVQQYNVNFSGIQYPIVSDAIILQDGNVLAVGGYIAVSNCSAISDKYKKLAYKFNPATGAKIMHKTYNHQSNATNCTSVQQKPNGIILLGGATTDESTVNSYNGYADVLKINSNLDSISTISFYDAAVGFSQQTNQLLLTPDGGFAAAIASYPTASQQKFWLLKADSNGCYTSTCAAVGIKDNGWLSGAEATIKVFPNPANDIINIECDLNNTETFKITITNTLGQEVLSETIYNTHSKISIQNLISGVYQLKISEGNRQRVLKFIKN